MLYVRPKEGENVNDHISNSHPIYLLKLTRLESNELARMPFQKFSRKLKLVLIIWKIRRII